MLKVSGGQSIDRAADRLLLAARGGLKRDLERALRRGTTSVEDYFRAGAREEMPTAGGFAQLYAAAKVKASRIAFGVRLTLLSKHDARRIERGRLRHPVHGNREVWADTRVPAGVVERAVRRADDEIKREIDAVMRRATGGS